MFVSGCAAADGGRLGLGSGAPRPGALPGVSPDGLREHEGTLLAAHLMALCRSLAGWLGPKVTGAAPKAGKPTWRLGGCSVTPPSSSAGAPAAIAGLPQRHVFGPART